MSSNLEIIRSLYQAFAQGDIPSVVAAFDPGIEWTETAGFPYGGTYIGPQAIVDNVFMKLGGEWDGFAATPDDFIDSGDRVVALGTYSGTYKATGKQFAAAFAHVWTLEKAKVVRFRQFADSALVWKAMES